METVAHKLIKKPDEPSSVKKKILQRVPYKLLGKKFSQTSRLVASSKVLRNAIPTTNCDIVLLLPAKTEDSTLMWLLSRLRSRTPHIHIHVRHLTNTGVYAFYMTSTYENFLRGAEELGIRKPLKSEFGGGKKEFLYDEQYCYECVDEQEYFLTSQERQSIMFHMLANFRALEGESLGDIKFLEGQPIVPLLESKKIVSHVFPLHNSQSLAELRKSWVQALFKKQPLDDICDYFGVKIAMYFAYLGHYTTALCFPACLGVFIWCMEDDSQVVQDLCFVTFALFNVFWATLYLEHWKRKSSELAYKWGTLDKKDELLEDPRPLYTGDLVTSPVTGCLEPYYPAWKRNLFRYCISLPIIGLCLLTVFVVMLLIFQLQEWVNSLVKTEDIPAFFRFLPKILLAVAIGIMDEIYKKIARWLNDMENYRMEETYENHLIIKLILFQFVNSFLSLFYIAFYLQDMNRLREQLAALLITRQVIGNIREAFLPYFLWKLKLIKVGYDITGHMTPYSLEEEIQDLTGEAEYKQKQELSTEETNQEKTREEMAKERRARFGKTKQKTSQLILTQAEMESTMPSYDDTFDDYLEMFIQYGYVTLFSSAFPLAALCAILNNIIEIRSDAFKFCLNHQRPFGKSVKSIGTWQDALEVMGVIAVIVNTALIGVSGQVTRMKPDWDTAYVIILMVVLEHLILALKLCVAYAIPDVPEMVATEMARLECCRRNALKRLESNIASPIETKEKPTFRSPSPGPLSPVSRARGDMSPIRAGGNIVRGDKSPTRTDRNDVRREKSPTKENIPSKSNLRSRRDSAPPRVTYPPGRRRISENSSPTRTLVSTRPPEPSESTRQPELLETSVPVSSQNNSIISTGKTDPIPAQKINSSSHIPSKDSSPHHPSTHSSFAVRSPTKHPLSSPTSGPESPIYKPHVAQQRSPTEGSYSSNTVTYIMKLSKPSSEDANVSSSSHRESAFSRNPIQNPQSVRQPSDSQLIRSVSNVEHSFRPRPVKPRHSSYGGSAHSTAAPGVQNIPPVSTDAQKSAVGFSNPNAVVQPQASSLTKSDSSAKEVPKGDNVVRYRQMHSQV